MSTKTYNYKCMHAEIKHFSKSEIKKNNISTVILEIKFPVFLMRSAPFPAAICIINLWFFVMYQLNNVFGD